MRERFELEVENTHLPTHRVGVESPNPGVVYLAIWEPDGSEAGEGVCLSAPQARSVANALIRFAEVVEAERIGRTS